MGRSVAIVMGVLLMLAATSGCGGKNGVIVDQATGARYSYKQILRQVEAFDTTADFTFLRMTFAHTKQYDPYGLRREYREFHDSAFAALDGDRCFDAIRFGQRVLRDCYPEIETHLALRIAYAEVDSLARSTYHNWVYESLIESILASGDGQSTETPFRVISVDEEYAFIRAFGFEVRQQALSTTGGHAYDIMDLIDPKTNDSLTWYFNIDYPYSQIGSIF